MDIGKTIHPHPTLGESTVRTHVRAIFGKTGARRLPELVRLVLSGPATLAG